MNDLDILDRFGPQPTAPSAGVMDAARARLDAVTQGAQAVQAAPAERRPRRRRLPLLAAAAAAAVGLAVTPALLGSDESVALATVDPLTFPLTPTALPGGLGDPVFERSSTFTAARYGPGLDGVSIVTDVEDQDFWSVPDGASTVDVDGHQATVHHRRVHAGTPDSAPAVTVLWQDEGGDWTAVTGSGTYADAGRVEAIAESLREQPQPVALALGVAPEGWSLVAYKEDRILSFAARGEDGRSNALTVALVERVSDLSGYGAGEVEPLTVNGEPAWLGRQAAEAGDPGWVLEAETASGQAFSLQVPADVTRDQVVRIAEGVTYTP